MSNKLLFLGIATVAVAASVSPLVISTNQATANEPLKLADNRVIELAQADQAQTKPEKKKKWRRAKNRSEALERAQAKLARLEAETEIRNPKRYERSLNKTKERIAKLQGMTDEEWVIQRKMNDAKRAKRKAEREAKEKAAQQ